MWSSLCTCLCPGGNKHRPPHIHYSHLCCLFYTSVVLEKTLENPLDCMEIKTVNFKGNQLWLFIGRTDAEAKALKLWPPDAKSWPIGKDAGKDRRQEEKGAAENEVVGWHHQCNGHEFERTPGDGKGLGSLACCSPWGHKELDMTEWVNNSILRSTEVWTHRSNSVIAILTCRFHTVTQC